MKTAQKVLMIIAGALSIFMVIIWAICAGAFFVSANNDKYILDYIVEHPDVTEEAAKAALMAVGIMFAIFALFSIINAALSFKAVSTDKKGLLVLNIIFAVLSSVMVNLVGAIFGFIARNQKKE